MPSVASGVSCAETHVMTVKVEEIIGRCDQMLCVQVETRPIRDGLEALLGGASHHSVLEIYNGPSGMRL